MKLNYECIDDIMTTLENIDEVILHVDNHQLAKFPNLSKYTADDITYCCIKLNELKLINVTDTIYTFDGDVEIVIQDISAIGHKYLEDQRILKLTNPKIDVIKQFTSSFLYDVSVGVASSALTSFIR